MLILVRVSSQVRVGDVLFEKVQIPHGGVSLSDSSEDPP
jgi:hypothetical protein